MSQEKQIFSQESKKTILDKESEYCLTRTSTNLISDVLCKSQNNSGTNN